MEVLLLSGGHVATATAAVGACAITTTVLGTNAALRTFWLDACRRPNWRAVAFGVSIGVPALAAATSKTAIFSALDFAGAYPVGLLWGLLPPLMTLRAQSVRGSDVAVCSDRTERPMRRLGNARRLGLLLLVGLSVSFVGRNAWGDITRSLGLSVGPPRWS